MKFIVDPKVFEKLPDVCFGVVIARGIDNKNSIDFICNLLNESIINLKEQLQGVNIKEFDKILLYRNAFNTLGFNPNKYLPSIEALITRIAKSGQIPNINSIVDLANAISIKHIVPIGAHDIDGSKDDIEVRFSKDGDVFFPFGSQVAEQTENGELIYSRGNSIKTRRWIWRQSEIGKITSDSKNIFFPIDGFKNQNFDAVISSRDELANQVSRIFKCEIRVDLIHKENLFVVF